MKKIITVVLLSGLFSGHAGAGEETTPVSVTGLWQMSEKQTVCFGPGSKVRVNGESWRQNGNYSCNTQHCSVTLQAVPNLPASANQWDLWFHAGQDELRLEGTDKKRASVKLNKIKESCS